jgi:HK97 family phage major capsid protein
MLRINALRQERLDAAAAFRALLDQHLTAARTGGEGGEPRGFTEPERQSQAAADTRVANLDALILAEERRLELETAAMVPVRRASADAPNAARAPWHTEADGDAGRYIGIGRWGMALAQAVAGRGMDPRLIQAAATGMGEATGEGGGFAVPVEYAPGIERTMFETGAILSRVDARVVSGNAITYTTLLETSRVDGSRQGGVLGYWLDEGDTKPPSQPKLARMELKLRKVAALSYMTDELLEDAAALGQELERMMATELIWQVENKIWRGTGSGTPLGFTIAPCFVVVAKESGQTGASIKIENLSKMWARLPPRSQPTSAWYCNVDCTPQLNLLAIVAGSGALEPRFIGYAPNGVMTIFGRPVIPVEYAETCGTVGDIVLADMQQYRLIRKASGVQQASSIHVQFTSDQTTFRAVYRVDGQPVPRAAITPYKGAATLSPFIGLETR